MKQLIALALAGTFAVTGFAQQQDANAGQPVPPAVAGRAIEQQGAAPAKAVTKKAKHAKKSKKATKHVGKKSATKHAKPKAAQQPQG